MSGRSTRNSKSPTYQPSSPNGQDDHDATLESATEIANTPIFLVSQEKKIFAKAKQLAPVDILDIEDVETILTMITEFSSDNSVLSVFDPNNDSFDHSSLKKNERYFKSKNDETALFLEKYNPFSSILESDHNLENPALLRMVGEQFKNEVRDLIIDGVITMELDKAENECFFLKNEIDLIINKKIKQTGITSVTAALKQVRSDKSVFLSIFNEGYKKFLNGYINHKFPRKLNDIILQDPLLSKVIKFNEEEYLIKNKILADIRIAYSPSGGGKTSLKNKYPEIYYDVDEFFIHNKSLFQKIDKIFSKEFKKYKSTFINMSIKMCIADLPAKTLQSKILLLNHPNQVPNSLKIRCNEIIIIPSKWNIRLRFFSENVFSLLFCNRYVKKIVEKKNYHEVIQKFFQV